jgi:hypothetical protein
MTRSIALKCACLFAVATLAGCTQNVARDDDDEMEQTVTMDQLPAAVRETLRREAGAGRIEEIDRVTEDGATAYEADIMLDGRKWEVVILADGKLSRKALDEEDDGEDDDDADDGKKDDD